MTIKQKAREIAEQVEEEHGSYWGLPEAARLGIIEGLEMAVAVVQTARFTNPESLRDSIAAAIRALIEEQKV